MISLIFFNLVIHFKRIIIYIYFLILISDPFNNYQCHEPRRITFMAMDMALERDQWRRILTDSVVDYQSSRWDVPVFLCLQHECH